MDTRKTVEPHGLSPTSDASLASLIRLAASSANSVERDARYLVDKLTKLEEAGTWPKALAEEPRTWERFCTDVLGYPEEYVAKVREGIAILDGEPTVAEAVAAAEALRARGRPKKGDERKGTDVPLTRGESPNYLRARLHRDHPDILTALDHGEYPSVRAAAKAAGIVHDPTPLEYLHRYWSQVAPDDRLRFLVEMLTPTERRALMVGLDEEEC